jgi:hypothetical protein
MMIDTGKAEVFEGQVAHPLHRLVDLNLARLDLLQQVS